MPSLRGVDCPKIEAITESKDDCWWNDWLVYGDATHQAFHEHRVPNVAVDEIGRESVSDYEP
jgi:hypothetical protein